MPEPNDRALTLDQLGALEPPQRGADGKTTIEHLRWKVQVVNQLMTDAALGRAELPKGYNAAQARELIDTEAKLCGYDPKHLMDVRTEAQVYADATRELLEAPSALFETTDSILEKIKAQMDAADGFLVDRCGAHDRLGSVKEAKQKKAAEKLYNESKKVWGERITKLLAVRRRARDAFPEGACQANRPAIVASHVLRFMLYVGRDSDGNPFVMGRHHGDAALALYEAESGKRWEDYAWVDTDFEGVMFVFPPGHGKTTFASHRYGLRIAQRPTIRIIHGHAQSLQAEKNLAYVASMFDTDTAQGRRLRSLFTDIPPIARKTHNVFDLAPIGGEKKRQPTMMAYGMMAKNSGDDADDIWFDDPCDQELAEQETTRVRIFDRMNGTWRARKRERSNKKIKTFEFTTTTLWHHDDPNARRIQLAKDKKIRLRVKMLACGGPNDGFKAIWEEVYPPSKLRQIYAGMRNPRLYAAAYQCNPQPDELRIIRRLRLYDPTEESHGEFMASAVCYLSIDPAATNTEKSDMAGMVYAAMGDVPKHKDDATDYVRELRVIDAKRFHATQLEAVDQCAVYSAQHRVDYVFWEVRSGFHAGPELMKVKYDLDVTPLDPGNRKKELRLRDASVLIDDAAVDKGLPPPPVAFPGVRDPATGKLVPDPALEEFYKQILDFGITRHDDMVDALTQMVNRLGPDLRVGDGLVSEQIIRSMKIDPRLKARSDRLFGRTGNGGGGEQSDDYRWHSRS